MEVPTVHTDDDQPGKRPPGGPSPADEETPQPSGFPERPDQAKVDALRTKLRRDRAQGGDYHRTPLHDRIGQRGGRSARDIGSYTMIPMMMVVGPIMGYLMGHYVEGRLGGEPWLGVFGVFFGLAAAVRQIILMLQRRSSESEEDRS